MSHLTGDSATPAAISMGLIIVCGLGRVGSNLVSYLVSLGARVVCIDSSAREDFTRADGVAVVSGDCRDEAVLRRAGVGSASVLVAVTSNEQANLQAALAARRIREEVRLVIRLQNEVLMERLRNMIPTLLALSTSRLSAPMIAAEALKGGGARWNRLGGFQDGRDDHHPWEIAQMVVGRGSQLAGITPWQSPARLGVVVAGIGRDPAPLRLLADPAEANQTIQQGDSLLLAGTPARLRAASGAARSFADELRFATWSRRLYRLTRMAFPYDLSVPVATMVLVMVLLASTILFSTVLEKSLADAIFRTVSIIATGGDMHEGDYQKQPWLKVFVSVLRIAGAALLALFTALLTNYFVRARLGEAFLVTRVPDSGHVVVCGLGKVGFELVRLLKGQGTPTAVIELDPQCTYIGALRRMGVPVINGDAGNAVVLGQAGAAGARAVIAVTSSDMVNLQIALVAKDLGGPDQAAVLLQADESFAAQLRAEANLQSALSIPELTAPAIAAAVYGDRVQALFRIARDVHAVVSRPLTGSAGQTWEEIEKLAGLKQIVPLYVLDREGKRHLVRVGAFPTGAERVVGIEKLDSMRERTGHTIMGPTVSRVLPEN